MPPSPPGMTPRRGRVFAATAALSSAVVAGQPTPSRRKPKRRRSTMAKPTRDENQTKALSKDELESQVGEALPDREQRSPINAALALNVLSDGSVAYANAEQTAPISQGNL